MSCKIIIHVGYPKTATTWLQRVIFPRLEEMMSAEGLNIISNESLSGPLLSDDYSAPSALKEAYPNSKIIITLRSQLSAIPSLYWLYVKSGGSMRYKQFLAHLMQGEKLQYHKLIKAYLECYDADDVLILLYEDLKLDRVKFLSSIAKFCGLELDRIGFVDEMSVMKGCNVSPGRIEIACCRLGNILNKRFTPGSSTNYFKKIFRYLGAVVERKLLFGKTKRWLHYNQPKSDLSIMRYYQPSNLILEQELGLDVSGRGYPV